jgi:tetratricopeptide (TPR) repeat protein
MADTARAKELIASGKLRDAGRLIERMLRERENDELWYLRGLVSLRLRNYDDAIEHFERALYLRKSPVYFRMKGVARMELFELELAIGEFVSALSLDPEDHLSNFYTAVCYMFLDDPRSAGYLKKAFAMDREKTRKLLQDFYIMFIRKDPLVGKAIKQEMERRLDRIKTN